MKKIVKSLPFKLLVGVIVGMLLGLVANEAVMNVVVTVKQLLGEVINFCVPLIVIGFIAPSITKLGSNASRMLIVALLLAYASSIGAALASMAAGYAVIPHLSIVSEVEGLRELPEVVFDLKIPAVMDVMSALAFSLLIGLGVTWTKSKRTEELLDEFQAIVLSIVSKVVIPVLPFFIASTFCGLAYEGTITKQLPVFIQVILIVMAGHYLWMALLYILAGIYSGKNPLEVVKHYGPAYITAVGTMSSAATLAVALRCAGKSRVLRQDMVDFGIPLFANIHLFDEFFVFDRSEVDTYIQQGSQNGSPGTHHGHAGIGYSVAVPFSGYHINHGQNGVDGTCHLHRHLGGIFAFLLYGFTADSLFFIRFFWKFECGENTVVCF